MCALFAVIYDSLCSHREEVAQTLMCHSFTNTLLQHIYTNNTGGNQTSVYTHPQSQPWKDCCHLLNAAIISVSNLVISKRLLRHQPSPKCQIGAESLQNRTNKEDYEVQKLAKMTNLTPATARKIQTGPKNKRVFVLLLSKSATLSTLKYALLDLKIYFLLSCQVCIEKVEKLLTV